MKLRSRLALLTALAVAVAVVLVSAAAFFAARDRLRAEIDDFLIERTSEARNIAGLAALLGDRPRGGRGPAGDPFRDIELISQVFTEDGLAVSAPAQQVSIPIEDADFAVARGERRAFLRDVDLDGEHYRLITAPAGEGRAVQIARSLEEVDSTLQSLGLILLLVGVAGVVVAGGAGLVVARRALAPVGDLTAAAEHVARTQDLAAPITVERDDELGRLAASFNAMLAALDQSRQQQRRLIADASHELRTPLTSLRTNIEVLAKQEMEERDRAELLTDVTFELEELSALVAELVDLATTDAIEAEDPHSLDLGRLAADVAERARRRTGRPIVVEAAPSAVSGRPAALERAISNLVDNACKWSPDGAPVEVSVSGGRVAVRDHGPGIAEEDRPFVFDRFYRARAARSMPGSGLGLAIVQSVVEGHGGRVWVEEAQGGGAIVGFDVPT